MKVLEEQRGLGPRLRVRRRAVGAWARFRAQRAILPYNSEGLYGPLAALRLRPIAPLALFCWAYTNIICV
jgi:hypothetical protein